MNPKYGLETLWDVRLPRGTAQGGEHVCLASKVSPAQEATRRELLYVSFTTSCERACHQYRVPTVVKEIPNPLSY